MAKNETVRINSARGTIIPAAAGFEVLIAIPEEERLLSWPVIAWRLRAEGKPVGAVTTDGSCVWLDCVYQKDADDDTGLRLPDGSVLVQGLHLDSDEAYWECIGAGSLRGVDSEKLAEMGFRASPELRANR